MTKLLDDLAEFAQLQKERESMEYGPDRAQAYEACLSKAFHLLDEHAAEIERNAMDAERYRHIKSAPSGTVRADFHSWAPTYYHFGKGKSLDDAIDTAMQETGR